MERNELNHSAHSTWRCQNHIVFAPKYRRKVIYGELKADIGQILRKLCEEKKVEISVQTTTSVVVLILNLCVKAEVMTALFSTGHLIRGKLLRVLIS